MAEPVVLLDAFGGRDFGRSWRFAGHVETLRAMVPDEVVPLLAQVEHAAANGLYAVGFVAYEAARALDPALPDTAPLPGLPLAWFALYRERREAAAGDGRPLPESGLPDLTPALSAAGHAAAVERIRARIAAGDSYQVNYTFPLTGRFDGDPFALYHAMGRTQRAPFCACLDTGPFVVISASPELFFSLKDGRLTARPMKGTAPRGRWSGEDRAIAEGLRHNPKERAENLMIVDLLRNDLGRVAETGSVTVPSLFDVESYPTVHQLTSTIEARLRPGAGLPDIFRALFPCGSVTGAPKRRSMEIIAELEEQPRGVYCGAIGCVAPGGEALFSVPIRTLVHERDTGRLTLPVGSGITWDSRSGSEYAECLAKAAFAGRAPEPFRLIESLRLEAGGYPLLERHLERLAASAAYFGFPLDTAAVRRALADRAAALPGCHKVRLLLAEDGSIETGAEPLAADDPARPLRLALAALRVNSRDIFRYHKTTRREALDRARREVPGCDEVLFVNEAGELTEGSYHNLVLRLDGRLVTPPLACGLLPGVMRDELLACGEIEERRLTPADLCRADGILLVNAVRGWRSAQLMEGELPR